MRLGFTGTRDGMTDAQKSAFSERLAGLPSTVTEFHHGACVGADAQAVEIVYEESPRCPVITAHLSDMPTLTDGYAVRTSSDHRDPKPPLDRNRDIVDAADELWVCPKGPEELRSGTWATVRYARKRKRRVRVVIFWPNGEVTEE